MTFKNLGTFDSLKLRDYRLLWLGQLSTSMGQWMDYTARGWLIYSLTHSPFQLGLVTALRGLPLVVFGVVAGVVADRYGRKAQLIIAQNVNAVLNLVLATLIFTGQIQVWHVYITALLSGTVQAFQQPARQVLIHDLVGGKQLMNAIALNSFVSNVSRSVGPAVCGVIIHFYGVDMSYFSQAALYVFATSWTMRINVPKSEQQTRARQDLSNQSILANIREGLAYILSHRLILALMVLGLAPTFVGMPFIGLMPLFAIDVWHGGATTQGNLLTMMGVGAVVGALIVASLTSRQGNGKLLICCAAGFGISLMCFANSPVVWSAMAFTFLAGIFNSSYTSQNQTMLQMLTPAELRGRVLGIYLLDRGFMPLGSLLAGSLASLFGGPWAVTIMGACCFLLATSVPFFVPDLWKSDLIPGYRERKG
jgi:MFS family permease